MSAHQLGSRFEAPLPLSLLFGGAGVTVALTAILLAFTVEQPTGERVPNVQLPVSPTTAAGLRATARTVFALAFVLTVATGLLGRQVQAENFATVFTWAVWLKGVAVLAALIGSPWRVLSPWQSLYDGLVRVEGSRIALLGDYPSRFGVWPALAAYGLWIGIGENLTAIPRSPTGTALLLVSYTLVMLGGGLAFGPAWFRNADALAVLYRLFGRVGPVAVTRTEEGGYRVGLRPPWQRCTQAVEGLAVTAFVVATVYTVSFDGFTSTPEYQTVRFAVQDVVGTASSTGVLLYLTGFVGFVAVFLLTAALTDRVGRGSLSGGQRVAVQFVPTILPIAVAYEIAHNYPFILGNVGQSAGALRAFFGLGRGPAIELLGWVSVGTFWWSQVVLIVAGHLVAVIAAHYVALERYESPRQARRAHIPFVALMIGYTVLSLWIISRPIVT
ncbi:MAG: hypothetical protein V5A56_13180 [Halolamina sp.]